MRDMLLRWPPRMDLPTRLPLSEPSLCGVLLWRSSLLPCWWFLKIYVVAKMKTCCPGQMLWLSNKVLWWQTTSCFLYLQCKLSIVDCYWFSSPTSCWELYVVIVVWWWWLCLLCQWTNDWLNQVNEVSDWLTRVLINWLHFNFSFLSRSFVSFPFASSRIKSPLTESYDYEWLRMQPVL